MAEVPPSRRDLRPRAQAELALEKVTVIRNDLSEADVVVVKAERKREEPREVKPAAPGSNPWAEAKARWINLKSPAEAPASAVTPASAAPSAELSQTPS